MFRILKLKVFLCVFSVTLLFSSSAIAADGYFDITQSMVSMAGGTYIIKKPGIYRLTSAITTTNPDKTVIKIASPNVTIDMNGYTIKGPITCSANYIGPVTSCTGMPGSTANGAGIAIDSFANPPADNVKIMNGAVQGMGYGLYLNGSGVVIVENVTVKSNNWEGMTLFQGTVRNSISTTNGGDGIDIYRMGLVQSCQSLHNKDRGILLEDGGVVQDSIIEWNGDAGILAVDNVNAGAQVVVSRNTIGYNGGGGIWIGGASLSGGVITDNTIFKNGGGGQFWNTTTAGVDIESGTVTGNLIHWNTGVGLKVGYAVSMRNNNFQGNNSGGAQTSGSVLYNGGGNMCGPSFCP